MTPKPAPRPAPRRPARKATRAAAAFTLTEILISLAMVAFLLIGISRIFAITSQTIGAGQALSSAVRTQRSITQIISADVLGVLPTSTSPQSYTGMLPLNDASNLDIGAPFLAISNFRVPTYISQQAFASDAVAPVDTSTMTPTIFADRSLRIRGVDSNQDGVESPISIASGGETTPLFFYGDRNFRCDTIGFFTRGSFQSQTGVSAITAGGTTSLQGELSASQTFMWYGHMRVFNSEATRLDRANAYGNPGDWLTPSTPLLPNRNNRFADQFVLGRMQMILSEPTDHDLRPGSYPPANPASATPAQLDRKLAEENTVVASNDPSKSAIFLQRNWWDPSKHYLTSARPLFSPFSINDSVAIYQPDSATSSTGRNRTLYTSDRTSPVNAQDTNYQSLFGRTDIAGVGVKQARQRARYIQEFDVETPPMTNQDEWWEPLYTGWNRRYWINPFVSATAFDPGQPNVNAKSLAQRQQMLTAGVSQFIVEFAGDFLTQDQTVGGGFGEVTAGIPDGILDFVAISNDQRRTRWYGLPRDVDGNGSIPAGRTLSRMSTDVLPVSIFADGFINIDRLPFEKLPSIASRTDDTPPTVIAQGGDYALNVVEPSGSDDPSGTSYVCVWGPVDFERVYTRPNPLGGPPIEFRAGFPQLLRFVLDIHDSNRRLAQPVTQEIVLPVPDEKSR